MTDHLHDTQVPGCYRCALSEDELPQFPDTEHLSILDDVALAASDVWPGADGTDASALLLALEDRGLKVERA